MSEYLSCAETAKLVRSALKAKWPGVKFSVRSKTYSGGASINVSYVDGPPLAEVSETAKHFEGATFDPMQDLKEYHETEYQGRKVHFGSDFVFVERSYTQEGEREKLVEELCHLRLGGITGNPPAERWGNYWLDSIVRQVLAMQDIGNRESIVTAFDRWVNR